MNPKLEYIIKIVVFCEDGRVYNIIETSGEDQRFVRSIAIGCSYCVSIPMGETGVICMIFFDYISV